MSQSLIRLYKSTIILLAIGSLFFLIFEPLSEGRNAHSTLFEVYFNDPFLAFVYVASLPYFVALYFGFKVLTQLEAKNDPVETGKSLRIIKRCSLAMPFLIVMGLVWILQIETDDRPPIFMMAFILSAFFFLVFYGVSKFEKRLAISTSF